MSGTLKSFVESIVDAAGPYTYLNGTPIVADAHRVFRQHEAERAKSGGDRFGGPTRCTDGGHSRENGGQPADKADRDTLGRVVREAWVRWASQQPAPKPSWLLPYDELSEPEKEADRQIGEAVVAYRAARSGRAASMTRPCRGAAEVAGGRALINAASKKGNRDE